jgi:hypothetical protein
LVTQLPLHHLQWLQHRHLSSDLQLKVVEDFLVQILLLLVEPQLPL